MMQVISRTEKRKGWYDLIIGVVLLTFCYMVMIPGLSRLMPENFRKNLEEQNIDATPLFYSQSEKTLKSYYFFELDNPR